MAFLVATRFHLNGHTYELGERYRVGAGKHYAKRLARLLRRGFVRDDADRRDETALAVAHATAAMHPARPSGRRDAKGHLMARGDVRPAGATCRHRARAQAIVA